MKTALTTTEKLILRDLSAGQSMIDPIAMRYGLTAKQVREAMTRLEKLRMVGSKTINNGKFTVYELR
jgi:DNA-binding GntR family transcriptional regulator